MNTLLLAPEILSSEGGIPRILQLYLRALCDLAAPGDELRLVALNDPRFDPVDLQRITGGRLTAAHACGRNKTRFLRETLRYARQSDRILCGHIAQLPVALAARLLNHRLHYDVIAHGIEAWRPLPFSNRLALRRARRVFCVSDYTRRELLRRCPLPSDRTLVVPNALDPAFPIAAAPLPAGSPPVILVVSRLTRNDLGKGFADMIRAFPAILAAIPSARLRIIGRGNALPDLQALVAQLGVTHAVEFLGYVDDSRLAAELRACTLFALPSAKEGFGLVFIEAMACGRPCLGALAGGIPEVITPETGVLPAAGDVPAIAAACIEALQKPWPVEPILDRARHFSYPRFVEHLRTALAA
jgi:phosphatidyl-myo-inositol dimannoside synthase